MSQSETERAAAIAEMRAVADGFTVLRGGQDLVMVGPNGRPEVVPLGGSPQQQGQASQGPQSVKDYITKMRADPRNGQFSDEQLTAEYNKKYGGAR